MTRNEQFVKAIEELDEDRALELTDQLMQNGVNWMVILDLLQIGVKLVGNRYEEGEYFIADLIMSGIIFRSVIERYGVIVPGILDISLSCDTPCMVMGTVEGDVHDIGKDIFISLLAAQGIRVIDLGTDTSPRVFADSIRTYAPKVVGMSGIMNFAVSSMKRTIDLICEEGLRDQVKIIVGGCCITAEMAENIGADGYSGDLLDGSALCKKWIFETEAD